MAKAYYEPGRPVVVLAGWLGCQPKNLRRYQELYQRLGFGVIIRIATPVMIVDAASKAPIPTTTRIKNQGSAPLSMQELAWDVIEAIPKSQCSVCIFHGFSNGGGFIWEQIRSILLSNSHYDDETASLIGFVRSRLVGIVFDSSPAWYDYTPGEGGTLYKALKYCSWKERLQTRAHLLLLPPIPERKRRAENYWKGMRNKSSDLRELYLYSQDDDLAPFEQLQELVNHRQLLLGKDRVWARQWKSSPHCCHLLKHPVEYQGAIESFMDACLYDKKLKPRL